MAICRDCGVQKASFMSDLCTSCMDKLAPPPPPPEFSSHVDKSGNLQCISCGSTQLHSGQRGYSFLRGGIFGSSQVVITCLKCGQKFLPGGKPY